MLKEFRFNIVLRVLLISALAFLLAYVLTNREWFFTPLVLVIAILISIWSLIHYIEKTNKDITHFILSIKQAGFTTSFSSGRKGKTFRKLSLAFNDVIEEFGKINLQRETHYQYLQTLTENIQVGIISFEDSGEIALINPAALQLLGKIHLKNISEIKKINLKLYQVIKALHPGERQLLKTNIGEKGLHLSVQVKQLVMSEVTYRIVLIQDIHQEMEEQEVDAWQKLIRVLTHEIMNSVTPIVSLTEALNTMMADSNGERKRLDQLDSEDKEDLFDGLQTIEKRSKGLLRFVNAYKDFTKTPELLISTLDITSLINHVGNLFTGELERNHISLDRRTVDNKLMAKGDAAWLEQVLINIFKNAIDALENRTNATIEITAQRRNDKTIITVRDNGAGMDAETIDKVFIPFFTTKKSGTGIGLSLSRQIMRLHKGTLTLTSEEDKGTAVMLEW